MPKKVTKDEERLKWKYNHIKGDLIELWLNGKGYAVIPTNGETTKEGLAVMGAGVAKLVAQEIPDLKYWLGRRLSLYGNHVHVFPVSRIITLPTKHLWKEPASLKLIESGLSQLDNLLQHDRKHYGGRIDHVLVPRLGCGNGGLNWKDVEPLVAKWLSNSSYFTVVSTPDEYEEHYETQNNHQRDSAGRRTRNAVGVSF